MRNKSEAIDTMIANAYKESDNMIIKANTMTIVSEAAALATLQRCDRARSSIARAALRAIVWERNIPLQGGADCVLSPLADILRVQEAGKQRLSASLWRCRLCGKRFLSERFLDRHQARRHSHVRADNGFLCLADLCGVVVPCPRVRDSTGELPRAASPCGDARERRARRAACVHAILKCLGGRNEALGHYRKYLEVGLCDAALRAECRRGGGHHRVLGRSKTEALVGALGWFAVGAVIGIAIAYALFRARWNAVGKREQVRGMWYAVWMRGCMLTRRAAACMRKSRNSARRRLQAGKTELGRGFALLRRSARDL